MKILNPAYIFIIFISSCSSIIVKDYSEPSDGPTANITFYGHNSLSSQAAIFEGAEKCTSRSKSKMISPGSNIELKVRAGAPLSFSFGYGNPFLEDFCVLTITANIEPGNHYSAIIHPTLYGCSLELTKLENGKPSVVEYQKRIHTMPKNEYSEFCR